MRVRDTRKVVKWWERWDPTTGRVELRGPEEREPSEAEVLGQEIADEAVLQAKIWRFRDGKPIENVW